VLYFSERLEGANMPRGAFVVNRFRLPPAYGREGVRAEDVAKALAHRHLALDDDAPARLSRAHADAERLAALDALHVHGLDDRAKGKVPIVRVPELATDVHDLALLARVAEWLTTGGV